MHVLFVTADPGSRSFVASLAERYLAGVQSHVTAIIERVDLFREAFDPRMTEGDLALYRSEGPIPEDVRREQLRIERAGVLILAFPIYWWSMPAVMKGWIDRVFTNGWAFGTQDRFSGPLATKSVRLIATGGSKPGAYEQHGYRTAIAAQIEYGIFHFSGVRDLRTHLFLDVENGDRAARLRNIATAFELGQALGAGYSTRIPSTAS